MAQGRDYGDWDPGKIASYTTHSELARQNMLVLIATKILFVSEKTATLVEKNLLGKTLLLLVPRPPWSPLCHSPLPTFVHDQQK